MSDDIRLDLLRDAICRSDLDGPTKDGKDGREFTPMFDIAEKAQRHKAKRLEKEAEKAAKEAEKAAKGKG